VNHREISQSGIANERWIVSLLTQGTPFTHLSLARHIGYDSTKHFSFNAFKTHGVGKTDVIMQIFHSQRGIFPKHINISCKKVMAENHNGFGHIHKSTIASYKNKWKFDNIIERCLNVYCGNLIVENKKGLYFDHKYFDPYQEYIKYFFRNNYDQIFQDLFKGRTTNKPEWFMITADTGVSKLLFVTPIDVVIEYMKGDRSVKFGKKATNQNLCLGNITMYSKRSKGQLQFKTNYKPMLKELKHKFRIFMFDTEK
tara:strand:+ start:4831 stop:5595 length:765 start_codon:yes stop_codon:yes gene_type:complete